MKRNRVRHAVRPAMGHAISIRPAARNAIRPVICSEWLSYESVAPEMQCHAPLPPFFSCPCPVPGGNVNASEVVGCWGLVNAGIPGAPCVCQNANAVLERGRANSSCRRRRALRKSSRVKGISFTFRPPAHPARAQLLLMNHGPSGGHAFRGMVQLDAVLLG